MMDCFVGVVRFCDNDDIDLFVAASFMTSIGRHVGLARSHFGIGRCHSNSRSENVFYVWKTTFHYHLLKKQIVFKRHHFQ